MGQAGLDFLELVLPKLKQKYAPELILVNGENITDGFGISKTHFSYLTEKLAVDVVTTGNHWNDQAYTAELVAKEKTLLVPANMNNVSSVDDGFLIAKTKSGSSFAVINLIGRFAMKGKHACPFKTASHLLEKIRLHTSLIIIDFHAEASSEKQALAHYLSSKISLLYGTHTHCQTADERILKNHTGFITDVGMTGAYDSVIGVNKQLSINAFLNEKSKKKFKPATENPWCCALIADFEPRTGRCLKVLRLSIKSENIDQFLLT